MLWSKVCNGLASGGVSEAAISKVKEDTPKVLENVMDEARELRRKKKTLSFGLVETVPISRRSSAVSSVGGDDLFEVDMLGSEDEDCSDVALAEYWGQDHSNSSSAFQSSVAASYFRGSTSLVDVDLMAMDDMEYT
mmetsp:Transcript_50787/g.80486  ORF Transcript_50787/g.80486 Transcript_50787/m.80486 type:complete len:136 (+) Transcript_50787:1-408(+)